MKLGKLLIAIGYWWFLGVVQGQAPQENSFVLTNKISFDTQYQRQKNYSVKNGLLSNRVTSITQDSLGYLWFGSNKGITRFDGRDFTHFTRKDGLQSNYFTTLVPLENQLLLGSNEAFYIKDQDAFRYFESKKVHCIAQLDAKIVLGTDKGIALVKDDFISPLRTNMTIDQHQVNALAYAFNWYWLATPKGLWKLDHLTVPQQIKKVCDGNVTDLLKGEQQLIATTKNKGIKRISPTEITTLSTTLYNVAGIKYIKNQYWLFSHTHGIEILNRDFSFNRKINKYNSLNTNSITDIAEDRQQNIWIGTSNRGLIKLESLLKANKEKPAISFEDIAVVYQTIDSINFNNYNGILQLPPSKNHLSFTYKSIDINNPKKVYYRYKLNDEYSPWTNHNQVNLANLQAGSYTFHVQSKIANEQESSPIAFQFYIDKPFYKKTWFLWSSGIGVFLLIVLSAYLTVKKIRAKNEAKIQQLELENHLLTLEQKALQLQMNPHFIFNVLNGIKSMGLAGKTQELTFTINKFSSLLRSILNTSRQEEVSLQEEITTLTNYLALEQQMSPFNFDFKISPNLSCDPEEILIPPMLIQPFVENSIKHGIQHKNDGSITLNFYDRHDFLHCDIIDNGMGIYQSQKNKTTQSHKSLAIKVTKERIANLAYGSALTFEELQENDRVVGTKVSIKIPLKTDF